MRVNNLNTKEFYETLEIVGNAISTKTTLPILTNVNIKFNDNKIILLGNNGTTAIKKVLFNDNFEIQDNGNVLVDFKTLYSIFSKLALPRTTLYTQGNQFIIENGKSVYRLNIADVEQYPNVDFKRLENEITINTIDLKNIISKVAICCATNEKKPILTGVNFKLQNNLLQCYATDSFALSKYVIDMQDTNNNEFEFTLPYQSLIALGKIINKTKQEQISILYNNNSNDILINVDNNLYKTRLLDGKYPDVSKIIPTFFESICRIDRQALLDCIDRCSVLSNKDDILTHSIIVMNFTDNNQVEITSKNNTLGEAKEILDCTCNFNLKIACGCDYLTQAIKSFECDEILVSLQNDLRPFTITEENNETLIQLLLPVKMID